MDLNTKDVVVFNDIVTDSSGQLKLNLPSDGGPINQLPNEMMQLVLHRVNLDGDVKKLVRLRLVSTRWNSLIEHYCKQKKSLIVNGTRLFTPDLNKTASQIVSLKSVDFFGTMLELFPNIEQLAIGDKSRYFDVARLCPSDDMKIRDFAAKINSLVSLKRLKIEPNHLKALPYLSQTLSRLEYIRVDDIYFQDIYFDLNQFISHLGPSCVRVVFGEDSKPIYSQVREWHNINPSWLANLTHFEFSTDWLGWTGNGAQILSYLSEHSTRLQTLKYRSFEGIPLEMKPTLIRALANLTNLTVLKLWYIRMDIAELEQAATQQRLASLSSVLDCELFISFGVSGTADQFTRILSAIFPGLTHLKLVIGRPFSTDRRFLGMVEQNVHRFPNLLKHEINFYISSLTF